MLELFRRNHFFYSLLLFVYAFLLRLPIQFAQQLNPPGGRGILTDLALSVLPHSGFLAHLISSLLIFLHAVILNRMVIRHRLTENMTLFPGVFYILFASLFPPMASSLHPLLIANTFVILALSELFASHRKTASAERIFNIGFWLSLASLCFFGMTVLFLFGLIGLSIQRTVRSREWMQYLIGFLTPYLIFSMIDYLVEDSLFSVTAHLDHAGFMQFHGHWTLPIIVQVVSFSVVVLIILLNYSGFTVRKNIHAQKKVDLLYWLLLFGALSVAFQNGIGGGDWLIIVVPVGIFMGMQFLLFRSNWLAESLHFLILVFCLAMQFWALL